MKKHTKKILVFVGIILSLYYGKKIIFPSDEDVILDLVADLSYEVSFEKLEHPLEIAKKAKRVSEFFTDDVDFKYRSKNYSETFFKGRRELVKSFLYAQSVLEKFEVDLIEVVVEVSGEDAEANLTVKAEGKYKNGKKVQEERAGLMSFRKEGGVWLVSGLKDVEQVDD